MGRDSHCNSDARPSSRASHSMATSRRDPVVLTRREWQLAVAVADGCSNAQIAEQLGISPHTVRNALSLVFLKAGVTNRVKLASLLLTGQLAAPE